MTLWGGRFAEGPDDAVWGFTVSTADRRLLGVDIRGSLAHLASLEAGGVLPAEEIALLREGLEAIAAEAAAGTFAWLDTYEDVHTAVEKRLGEVVGAVAGKLHTGRSRNDQIALDLRLYLDAAAVERISQIEGLVRTLADQAEAAGETVVAAYTHLQQAQAVPLAHHLLAHAWALLRDADRFGDALARIRVSPLGAGAGGGSRLALDPAAAAAYLGWETTFTNSMDAVGSRDLVAEYLFCCAQTFSDLSRLAEEMTLWATPEFGWVTYADRHTTGSSALPHKKNPDPAELARGKAASTIGHLTGMLAVLKGLPLTYDRDLQQDKEHLFPADDDLAGALAALTPMLAAARFHPPPPGPWVAALDLAEVLVERGVPFREAHSAVGALVAAVVDPATVTDAVLAAHHTAFQQGDAALLDPTESVRGRRSAGGGSFESVQDQITALRARVG